MQSWKSLGHLEYSSIIALQRTRTFVGLLLYVSFQIRKFKWMKNQRKKNNDDGDDDAQKKAEIS